MSEINQIEAGGQYFPMVPFFYALEESAIGVSIRTLNNNILYYKHDSS